MQRVYDRTFRPFTIALAMLIFSLAPRLAAGNGSTPARWNRDLDKAQELGARAQWSKAHKRIQGLLDEMIESRAEGLEATRLMARTLALQAAASYRLGDASSARWSWEMAHALDPQADRPMVSPALAAILNAGIALVPALADPASVVRPPIPLDVGFDSARSNSAGDSLPRLEIEFVVDAAGNVRQPRVVSGGEAAARLLVALEPVGRWRFAPALGAGDKPIAVRYTMRSDPPWSLVGPHRVPFVAALDEYLALLHRKLVADESDADDVARTAFARAMACIRKQPSASSLGASESSCHVGEALLLRALALESGSESAAASSTASWMIHGARSLDPSLATSDLIAYGAAGARLAAEPTDCTGLAPSKGCAAARTGGRGGVTPPRVQRRTPMPVPPTVEGADRLLVRLVVNEQGAPEQPFVVAGHWPMNGLAALDALRTWHFEPAQAGGRAVAAVTTVSIPFAHDDEEELRAWRTRLAEADGLLLAGETAAARTALVALREELIDGLGVAGSDLLASTLTLSAIAEARSGERETALWHWYTAQNLAVELRDSQLSAYGEAGALLGGARIDDPGLTVAPERQPTSFSRPSFTELGDDGAIDIMRVELSVDADGMPLAPRVISGGRTPARLVLGLEAIRTWRFAPGTPGKASVLVPLFDPRPIGVTADDGEAKHLIEAAAAAADADDAVLAGCLFDGAQSLTPAVAGIDLATRSARTARALEPRRRAPEPYWGPTSDTTDRPQKLGPNVTPPKPLSRPHPSYTDEARALQIQGYVVTRAVIDTEGRVPSVRVLEGLPNGLTARAVDSQCRGRWEPARWDGKAVSVSFNQTTHFSTRMN